MVYCTYYSNINQEKQLHFQTFRSLLNIVALNIQPNSYEFIKGAVSCGLTALAYAHHNLDAGDKIYISMVEDFIQMWLTKHLLGKNMFGKWNRKKHDAREEFEVSNRFCFGACVPIQTNNIPFKGME